MTKLPYKQRVAVGGAMLGSAAVSLGYALNIKDGLYDPEAVRWLGVALALCVGVMVVWRPNAQPAPLIQESEQGHNSAFLSLILALCVAVSFWTMLVGHPGNWWHVKWEDNPSFHTEEWHSTHQYTDIDTEWGNQQVPKVGPLSVPGQLFRPGEARKMRHELPNLKEKLKYQDRAEQRFWTSRRIEKIESALRSTRFQIGLLIVGAIALAAVVGGTLAKTRRHEGAKVANWERWGLVLFLAGYFGLGVWVIRVTPRPHIDVWVFQQESCAALLRGENPYAMTYENIYGRGVGVYGASLMSGDRLDFGYPYMPLSLLMALPGYAVAGDHRYSQLLAMVLAGGLIAFCQRGIIPKLAALLLLFSPRAFMLIEMGWTEPFVIVLLAGTVFCALRWKKGLPWALGLLLASKQYTIFMVPLLMLLMERPFMRKKNFIFLAKTLALAAFVSLPMMVWNYKAFWHSAVALQLYQPLRNDALSFLIRLHHAGYPSLANRLTWVAFPAAAGAILISLRIAPRAIAGFAAATALTYLAFFATNKQAFANYYFLVIAAMVCALAAANYLPPSSPSQGPVR